jgi:hypothetical protein
MQDFQIFSETIIDFSQLIFVLIFFFSHSFSKHLKMKLLSILLLSISSFSLSLFPSLTTNSQASINDFKEAIGTHTGLLSYKDYSSDNWVSLTLVGATYIKKNKLIIEHLIVEGSELYKQKYSLAFKNEKAFFNGAEMKIIENSFNTKDSKKQMVLTNRGKDGNESKKCTFRHTITFENQTLTIIKEVKFDDEESYFTRNKYVLNKYS